MEAVLLNIVQKINGYLSDYILIILLIGAGLYFSIRTRFVQVRCFGEGMRRVFGNINLHGGKQQGGFSSFQALATAIAAQVGTGNIVLRRYPPRWSRRHLLDVDHRLLRHGYHLCGSGAGAGDPCGQCGRQRPRRPSLLHQACL